MLQEIRVDTVFCLSGAAHAYLLREMVSAGITVISTRTEAGTVAAADGYARVKGGLGVAMIAGKQGLPNAVGGVRTAQLACSPVLVMASVYDAPSTEAIGDEATDPLVATAPFAKWSRSVPSAARVEEFLGAAIHAATSGRPGVSVLGLPTHFAKAEIPARSPMLAIKQDPSSPSPSWDAIARAADLIAGAKRPLILAGTGSALSGAGDALTSLSALGIPVFGHALGRGVVVEDMKSGFPWPLAQVAARHADVVISFGLRLGQRIGYGMEPRFSRDARFIQIDISPSELGRNRQIEIPIVADARLAAVELLTALEWRGYKAPEGTGWVGDAIATRLDRLDELGRVEEGPIHPLRIGRELMRLIPQDAIIVSDGADIYNWMSGVLRIRSPRSYLDHFPLGSMGIGTGLALGAAAAAKEAARLHGAVERRVVLITGDGSFGYYAAELNSMKLADLPIACVISNDGAWGTEKNGHLMHWDESVNCELGQCDYHLIGQAYGCIGKKVTTPDELAPALELALTAAEPSVINVLTDPDAGLARKQDPRLQMVTFEDLPSSLDAHYVMELL